MCQLKVAHSFQGDPVLFGQIFLIWHQVVGSLHILWWGGGFGVSSCCHLGLQWAPCGVAAIISILGTPDWGLVAFLTRCHKEP